MESNNKFENDTGGMSVDEIIADIDRKTANAEALEENSVGVTPEGENEMSDEQVAVRRTKPILPPDIYRSMMKAR